MCVCGLRFEIAIDTTVYVVLIVSRYSEVNTSEYLTGIFLS